MGKHMKTMPCLIAFLFISCSIQNNRQTATYPWQFETVVEWEKQPDSKTGHPVWQITNHDSASEAFYFERQAFTDDDRYLVFYSDRSGSRQLHRADLTNGKIIQLTNFEHIGTAEMHPDGRHCLFQAGQSLLSVDVPTGRIDTVMLGEDRFPSSPRWAGSYSADGNITVAVCHIGDSTQFFLVNLITREIKHILTWPGRISHPQVCPTEPDLITFVPSPDTQNDMTLPMEKRARTWIVDARTGQARQFLTCPYGFRATHETWTADGKRFFFYKKTVPGWIPVAICSINQEGNDWQEHYTHETIRLGHGVASRDQNWFITDSQDPGTNPLILVNLRTGEDRTLCWTDASITHQHVHPFLSRSGRFVGLTSDRTGTSQVYVVPVP